MQLRLLLLPLLARRGYLITANRSIKKMIKGLLSLKFEDEVNPVITWIKVPCKDKAGTDNQLIPVRWKDYRNVFFM